MALSDCCASGRSAGRSWPDPDVSAEACNEGGSVPLAGCSQPEAGGGWLQELIEFVRVRAARNLPACELEPAQTRLGPGNQARRSGAGLVSDILDFVQLLENLPIPTVVAVHGMCMAAGMEFLLAHDIAFAAEGARIGQSEALIGTTTLAGGAQRIAARAGVASAKEMVFEGKLYDAATMANWNIVNNVVPDAELHDQAMAYARRLAAGPAAAHMLTKSVFNAFAQAGTTPADRGLMAGAPSIFETRDKRHGVETFLKLGGRAFASGAITFEGR